MIVSTGSEVSTDDYFSSPNNRWLGLTDVF